MRERILLCALLVMLFFSVIVTQGFGAEMTTTSVTPLTTVKPPGEDFFITLDVTNVQKLWGYQYKLRYNTTVLTALNFTNQADLIYPEFTVDQLSEINDTAGFVFVSFSASFGDKTGLTTVESKPLAKIAFHVEMEGSSTLDIDDAVTRFIDVYGDPMGAPYNLKIGDGYFSTHEIQLHDIAITGVTVSPTSADIGDTVSVDVAFRNNGDFTENFTIAITYNATGAFTETIDTKAVTNLAADASSTLNFSWDTSEASAGKYVVRAEAIVTNEAYTVDNTRESNLVTLSSSGGGWFQSILLYIAVAIVIVIVIVIVIFVLRRR